MLGNIKERDSILMKYSRTFFYRIQLAGITFVFTCNFLTKRAAPKYSDQRNGKKMTACSIK